MKQNYLLIWKEYKKVLKQRNALLKTKAPYQNFIPWDKQLSELAAQLDELRSNYFSLWETMFYKVLDKLSSCTCTIQYYRGWDKKNTGRTLMEVLAEHFNSDLYKQYTQYGPHQADILIHSDDNKAKQVLSRGQQKIILIALKLAQSELINGDCLYLFDDLPAELDELHQRNLFDYLQQTNGQYVITSINSYDISKTTSNLDFKQFNIQSGVIQ